MKRLFILICFIGCGRGKDDSVRSFIPGMYVRDFAHEFSKGSDTLVLRLENQNNYTILKRSGFERLRNGAWQDKEYRQEIWSGIYHPEDGVMEEFKKGKILHFRPEERKLVLGSSEYVKVSSEYVKVR